MHNPAAEAQRWWEQALDDRAFVQAMAQEGRFFDKACFTAQQAAEKALKACLYAEGRREVIGRALLEFVRDLAQRHPEFAACGAPAARLDRHYIPTRYPNGLPGGSPFQSYSAGDLASALADLEALIAAAQRFLRSRGVAPAPPE
jgi:HEPN domain-containing protein